MGTPSEPFKINPNQNLVGLVIGLLGMGVSEYFQLRAVFGFCVALTVIMTISIAWTTLAYTLSYWKSKMG